MRVPLSLVSARCATLCAAVVVCATPNLLAQHAPPQAPAIVRHTLAGRTVELRTTEQLVELVLGSERVRVGVGIATVARVPVGNGEALVVHVRGAQDGAAVVAGSASIAPAILHAGPRVVVGEDATDRTITEVLVRDLNRDGRPDVLVGQRHADASLCGFGAPMVSPRSIDPSTLRLRAVVLDPLVTLAEPLTQAPRAIAAVSVAATEPRLGVPTLAAQGRVSGAAVAQPALVLHDGDPATSLPLRVGDVLTARVVPPVFELSRVELRVGPDASVFPSAFLLAIGDTLLDVRVPQGVTSAGRIAVPLVPARAVSCVAMIVREVPTGRVTSLSELTVVSQLDRDPNPVATLIAGLDGADGDAYATTLRGLGPRAVTAVSAALATLPDRAARRAIRLLDAMRTPEAAEAIAGALSVPSLQSLAHEVLVRWGPAALEALSTRSTTSVHAVEMLGALRADPALRARAARGVLQAEPDVWRASHGTLQALLASLPADAQLGWAESLDPTSHRAHFRGLAVLFEAASSAAVREAVSARAASQNPSEFADRYLRLRALGASEPGVRLLVATLTDTDADLRAEAARALALCDSQSPLAAERMSALVSATHDPVARVRAASLETLARVTPTLAPVLAALSADTWPSVRAQIAESLTGHPDVGASLLAALEDPSVLVVRAVLSALERTPAPGAAPRLLEFVRDPRRHPELRFDALGVIAARCERSLAPALEPFASERMDPALPEHEQRLGHGALATLARLDPVRARAFLTRVEANATARLAVENAARHACPATP
ncbi:MAG: HEAT repeat domain-containing protein [Deltaproteobacteria bacterium]|nr:HEAT repeat domain-containing protein [Deltaproteobacteria bacterium]